MFTDDEWVALISKLRQLTEEEKLQWSINTGGSVYTEINDVTYIIDSQDDDGAPPFVLHVRTGSEIDWTEVDAITSIGGVEMARDPRTKVLPLQSIARRMALGGPQLAKRLLGDLERIDPTTPPIYGQAAPPWIDNTETPF
jgi:hypothetical protein